MLWQGGNDPCYPRGYIGLAVTVRNEILNIIGLFIIFLLVVLI